MVKAFNIFMVFIIFVFILSISNYYFSKKNINSKNFNRSNIDQILKEKITDLPILLNDTNNVIEFNNSIESETDIKKKRSFWDLIKK
tara:strand:+ start:285 stop:545 length:261 start_codon:yes stop_codon:yes gene_type:complete